MIPSFILFDQSGSYFYADYFAMAKVSIQHLNVKLPKNIQYAHQRNGQKLSLLTICASHKTKNVNNQFLISGLSTPPHRNLRIFKKTHTTFHDIFLQAYTANGCMSGWI